MKMCRVVFNTEDEFVEQMKERRGQIFKVRDSRHVDEKMYTYHTFLEDLKIGDRVVVQANNSYQVATFIQYTNQEPREVNLASLKLVVGIVDFTEYEHQVIKQAKMKELKAKMEARRQSLEELTLFTMLAKEDAEMARMLEEYSKLDE